MRSNSTASRHSPAPLKPITPPRSYSFDGLASMSSVPTPGETASSITMTISPPPITTATDTSMVPPSSSASVPFPKSAKSARTSSIASGSSSISPLGATPPPLRPRSPGPQLTSFPAYRAYERTPPTSAMQPNFVIGESIHSPLGPNRPSHRTSAGRNSFSGWLGWAAGMEVKEEAPTPALSNLARVAEDHHVSPRTEAPPESPQLSARRPTSYMSRNPTSPARFPHEQAPMLHVVHDANARRKSDEWSSRLGWGGLSPAEAMNEFSEGVKKKQSGEMLSGSISTLPARTTRSRGGSLGRDSRLYGEDAQPDPFWGTDVGGVRVGECSALTGEGQSMLLPPSRRVSLLTRLQESTTCSELSESSLFSEKKRWTGLKCSAKRAVSGLPTTEVQKLNQGDTAAPNPAFPRPHLPHAFTSQSRTPIFSFPTTVLRYPTTTSTIPTTPFKNDS